MPISRANCNLPPSAGLSELDLGPMPSLDRKDMEVRELLGSYQYARPELVTFAKGEIRGQHHSENGQSQLWLTEANVEIDCVR